MVPKSTSFFFFFSVLLVYMIDSACCCCIPTNTIPKNTFPPTPFVADWTGRKVYEKEKSKERPVEKKEEPINQIMKFSLTTILALSSSLLSSTASAWLVRIPIHLIHPSIYPSSQVVPSTSSGSTNWLYIYLFLYIKSTNQKGIYLSPSPSPFLELRYSLWRRRLQR